MSCVPPPSLRLSGKRAVQRNRSLDCGWGSGGAALTCESARRRGAWAEDRLVAPCRLHSGGARHKATSSRHARFSWRCLLSAGLCVCTAGATRASATCRCWRAKPSRCYESVIGWTTQALVVAAPFRPDSMESFIAPHAHRILLSHVSSEILSV